MRSWSWIRTADLSQGWMAARSLILMKQCLPTRHTFSAPSPLPLVPL